MSSIALAHSLSPALMSHPVSNASWDKHITQRMVACGLTRSFDKPAVSITMAIRVLCTSRAAVPARAMLLPIVCCTKPLLTSVYAGCRKTVASSDVCGQSWRRYRPPTTKPPGHWAPEGRWTRTLACRVSVMAAARPLRQVLVAGSLEDVRDQPGQGSALLVGPAL